jgi:hypothetical protein
MTRKPTKKQWQTTVDVLRNLYAECESQKMDLFTPALKRTIDLVDFIRPQ